MNEFRNYNDYDNYREESTEQSFNAYLSRVFMWMFSGLAMSFATAYLTAHNMTLLRLIFGSSITVFALILVEIGLVSYLSVRIMKLSYGAASGLFMLYSFLNGLTLSAIFLVYNLGSIYTAFLIAAALFAVMAVYGKVTKRDLSPLGSFFMMGLIGIILSSIINYFMKSDAFSFVISGIAVFVFAGLTAWDMQKLKRYHYSYGGTEIANNLAVLGALDLYLDFINLFLHILRLISRRN
ncbi:MAG: Bax inhibitor-1/YccA family protein [Bacillota bacterium]|nr:Bax inhibitor-1/YccA family protein [Bacillota bacterium]